MKSIAVKVAQLYSREIFPYLRNIRGSVFISRGLQELAFRFSDKEKISINGIMVNIDSSLVDEEMVKWLVSGNYEREEYRMVKKHIRREDDVIELGGGLGYISCVIDSIISDKSLQIVLEPNSDVVNTLEKNMELNNADFRVLKKAYSSNDQDLEIELGERFLSSSALYNQGTEEYVQAEGISLKTLISDFQLNDFVAVVDAEGAEYEIIKDEISHFSNHCRKLIVEFHQGSEECWKYNEAKDKLEENNFELVDEERPVQVFENKEL